MSHVALLAETALRLARAGGPIADALVELRELAGGRGDLLAEAAGRRGGAWAASPDARTGDVLVAVGLLVMAGADHDRLGEWFEVGRTGDMTTPGLDGPVPRA